MLPCGVFNRNPQQDMAIVRTKTQWLLLAAGVAFLFTMPLWLPMDWRSWLITTGIYVVAVLGLHITTGLCGQFQMGHSGFMAVGAYTTAVLTTKLDWSPWLTLPLSGLTAGLIGLVFGVPALRIKGFYLVMATIAAQFIILFVIKEQSWTGGKTGLHVPQVTTAASFAWRQIEFWWLTLAIALAGVLFAKNIQRTSPGRQMVAVRDNDLAAEVMGINLFRTKLLAFFLGCFYAGIGGWLMAHNARYIHPDIFSFGLSLSMLGMVIVGGMGSTSGAVLGTVAIQLVDKLVYYLTPQVSDLMPSGYATSVGPALQLIVFGLVVMAFLLFEPRGIQHRVEKIKLYYRLRPFSY